MTNVPFRAWASWDDIGDPQDLDPSPAPWGLGDEPPPVEPLEGDDVGLCVACWEWHGHACPDGRDRRVA